MIPSRRSCRWACRSRPRRSAKTGSTGPALPDLFPASFPGVKTSRDSFLVDIDLDRLKERITDYFDAELSHEEIAQRYPVAMKNLSGAVVSIAREVRATLLSRGGPSEAGFVRYAYRPIETRWLYWESETKLLDAKRADYKPHVFEGNLWLVTPQKQRKEWSPPLINSSLGDINQMDGSTAYIPAWLRDTGLGADENWRAAHSQPLVRRATLPRPSRLGRGRPLLPRARRAPRSRIPRGQRWRPAHGVAAYPLPGWTEFSAPALRRGGSRTAPTVAVNGNAPSADQSVIPTEVGTQTPTDAADPSVTPAKTRPVPGRGIYPPSDAAQALATSAARGRQLAHLLDSDTPVPGVTAGTLRPEIAAIAVPATSDDRNMTGKDFALTAGWGHYGAGEAVMPGQGKAIERAYTPAERDALPSRHTGASRNPELPSQPKPLGQGETANRAPESISAASILGENHLRHLPQRARLLAQRPRQRLALQARRLPSPQEMALLPRTHHPPPPLKPEEVQHFTDTARRIGAILQITSSDAP